jgi:hypothetical protein
MLHLILNSNIYKIIIIKIELFNIIIIYAKINNVDTNASSNWVS